MSHGLPSIVLGDIGTEFQGMSFTNYATLISHKVIIYTMANSIIRCSVLSTS
jgi:hypothetical protein